MAVHYRYVVVGAGLAGASAIEGIRECDSLEEILLVGSEKHLPYDRPPLSKKLWFGRKKVEEIFLQNEDYYIRHGVKLALGTSIVQLDAKNKRLVDSRGQVYEFDKLLLATGGIPRRLTIPGGDLENVCYYHTLDDYRRIRSRATPGSSAAIIGGGFIGSEMAAALAMHHVRVTMVFPEPHLAARVFPETLSKALQQEYSRRGIRILAGDMPTSFASRQEQVLVSTKNGEQFLADFVIAGVGLNPAVDLAQKAALQVDNGIVVNSRLQTSHPDIWAAGDNALFPCVDAPHPKRVEHWDNALCQGKLAGRNMAGAMEPYTHLPYFFSDLFEFGYEAVGETNSSLQTIADWQKENEKGVLYYLKNGRICGVMMCNVWDKIDAARALILEKRTVNQTEVKGLIA